MNILIILLIITGQFTEGIFSNSSNIKHLRSMPEQGEYSIQQYLSNDAVTDYLISVVNMQPHRMRSSNRLDSMLLLYERGLYERLRNYKPQNYIEHYIRTASYIAEGLYDSALYANNRLKEYKLPAIDTLSTLIDGAVLYITGHEDSAYELVKYGNDNYYRYIYALCLLKRNSPDSALSVLQKINTHKINHSSYIVMTDILIEKEKYSEAMNYIENFEEEFKQSEKMPYILYAKGYIYYKRGYFNRSISILKEMTAIARNSILKGNAMYLIGKNYFMLGDYENMENSLQLVKNELIPSDFRKNAIFLDGKGMFFNGDYRKAADKLEEFIALYPEDFLTPYAYQILAQSYFYMEEYTKSLKYIKSIKNPEFVVDKLIMMKYFIDYKQGVYDDSISAYISFIDREKNNPLRKDAYEYIISSTDDIEIEIEFLRKYLAEFPDNEEFYPYFAKTADYLVFYERFSDIYWFCDMLATYINPCRDRVFTEIINKMHELKMHAEIVEFYSRYADKYSKEDFSVVYRVGRILINNNDYEGAQLLFANLIEEDTPYADSSIISTGEVYALSDNIDGINRLIAQVGDPLKLGFLYRFRGDILQRKREYEHAVNSYLTSAEMFGENRNDAAVSIVKAAQSAYAKKDYDYARILLDRASILAQETEVINRIKVLHEEFK